MGPPTPAPSYIHHLVYLFSFFFFWPVEEHLRSKYCFS